MTLSAYTLRPSLRAALTTFLVHRNPFYLISALFMLTGCYALNSGLATRTGDLGKVFTLLGVLNLYEAMLIALGLYLIRKRGVLRDGRTLLLLEAPFLVDLGFLNAEMGSGSIRAGCLLNFVVLALALVKTALVLHALWGRLPRRTFAFIGLELGVLFFMPCIFARCEHGGNITLGQFYAAWWVIGLLMVVYELQAGLLRPESAPAQSGLALFICRLYVALPLASIILHLSLLHWVYRVAFLAGDLSPLLLGATFVLGRSAYADRGDVRNLRILMPLAALVLTMESPPVRYVYLGAHELTPAILIVVAAYVTYVYCFFLNRAIQLLCGGAIVVLVAVFGPTLGQFEATIAWAWQRLLVARDWLASRSAIEWGVAAMTCAFAFLGLGALVSLREEPMPPPPAPSSTA